jgi:hypothetical protein
MLRADDVQQFQCTLQLQYPACVVVKENGLTSMSHSGKKDGCMKHGAIQWEGTMLLRKAGEKHIKPTLLRSQFVSELNMKYTSTSTFQNRPHACLQIFFETLLCC